MDLVLVNVLESKHLSIFAIHTVGSDHVFRLVLEQNGFRVVIVVNYSVTLQSAMQCV